MKRLIVILGIILTASILLASCSGTPAQNENGSFQNENNGGTTVDVTKFGNLDITKWSYNADDNVYYQLGLCYCENPADESYENLAIFVPGDYMTATDNGDDTYSCKINSSAKVGNYTAKSAPIVMPIETPGYSAQSALSSYNSFTEYTNEGFVYVHAGCRGRDQGAPSGVTDLKAAIRYLRYVKDDLAGDTDRIFVFGMSGGGAQSAIVGSTGDSDLYNPYLKAIGAVMDESDAVTGSMDWCPITNLDTADAAYEWMMGATRSGLSDDEQKISDSLAEAFAEYINSAGIKDEDANTLTLEKSDDGIYQAGSYYEYIKKVIENSLNTFLKNTEFPYDSSSSNSGGRGNFGGGRAGGQKPDGNMNGGNFENRDNISRNESSNGITISGTYDTAQDYIDALNANGKWVTYDEKTNTATITSVEDFTKALKSASKSLGAFDQLDSGQGENTLFGYGDGNGAHFDSTLADILNELGSKYASSYKEDLEKTDSVGNTAETRLNMYSPLYYLLESEDGYGTSTPAKYWRIRTGIEQGDTALSTEVNLALALENYDGVKDVDFATVWGQGHTTAEISGTNTANFISWVNECADDLEK